VSAALDAKGLKRVCASCGIRFYDMNKRPIKCPNCATEFTSEIKLKTRRGRAAVAEAPVSPAANDENEEQIEQEENTVSLDEVAEAEEGDDDDLGIEGGMDDDDIEDLDDDDLEDEDIEVEIEKE
jgi:uncharacterized protein (TIGR02300 family)